jgi:dTDP-4-dehydrorhamnose 3,5-epimerase
MIFQEMRLPGAFIIEPEPLADQRGFFARTWCRREFSERGLSPDLVQCNISSNARKGTLRGMHFQVAPHAEVKLVRCTRGAIYDVIIDLRPSSPTYLQWIAVELSALDYRQLYIPEGFAHGFQTLVDDSDVFYQMSEFYHSESARGVRWDDPAFGITWPLEVTAISTRDQNYPLLEASPNWNRR